MSAKLGALYPDAGELLRIAARDNRYPEGRNGYNV
jgi:hypothetical protein